MFRFLRRVVPWLVVVLLMAAFGLFTWMSAYPNAPVLVAAEDWPWVGEHVARFRRAYRAPAETTAESAPGGPSVEYVVMPDIRYEPRPEARPTPHVEPLWFEPGMVIRAEPSADARAVGEISKYRKLLPTVTRPPWYRVRTESGGRTVIGWVRVDRPTPAPGEPLLGNAPAPVLPVPGSPPEPTRLARARDLLGSVEIRRLGPYDLYTDVSDAALARRLDRVAGALESAYRRRFGVVPVGRPRAAVVLFRGESTYRAFQGADARLRGLPAGGHAGRGLAALYVGDQAVELVSAVLVHELTHLLTRRAVGPALPPWLDEGLAEDLGWSEIDAAGRPVFGSWGGVETREGSTIYRSGGMAVVRRYRLKRTLGRLLPLRDLLALDWADFVRREEGLAYVQSGLLVRYLLESGHRDRFRRFLADTARGEPIGADRLERTLEIDLTSLGDELDAWVMGLPVS